MGTHRTWAAIALAVGAMAFAPHAHAWQEVSLNGSGLTRNAPHTTPVMSREALRACVTRRDELNRMVVALRAEDAAWSAEALAIKRLKEDIDLEAPMVDRYSPESVNAYNALIDQAAKRTAARNEGMKKLGARYYEHKRLRASFARECGGAYYADDLQAVAAETP